MQTKLWLTLSADRPTRTNEVLYGAFSHRGMTTCAWSQTKRQAMSTLVAEEVLEKL